MSCSLDHGIWAYALITNPEGTDHPVVLGRAGDCQECLEALDADKERYRIPVEVVEEDDPEARSSGEFCQCRQCKFVYNADGSSPFRN